MGKPLVEDHWHTLVEGFSTSSLEFYDLVKEGLARRKLPDLKITTVEWKESGLGSGMRTYLRVSREHHNFDICAAPFGTGYFFSWWLARIRRVLLDFGFLLAAVALFGILSLLGRGDQGEIRGCAGALFVPTLWFGLLFGLGALVRYGDMGLEPAVLSMPITGFFYQLVFRPVTYFNEDTALVFRESVHAAVMEAIDQVTAAEGIRGLTEEARRLPPPSGKPHLHLT